ncbi:uncharacterized protein N7446_011679 [Penicillium canescens]|uniref:FAD/NAD(P)-binding domain-containing protein n=1 Tax=Penicillium canescens TaxID=5083 RepID=A0AAD6IGS5_PENCN|nr:uncharacterized protein N7446_011679 [Penicillium canescens]KAJ6028981.1 hypothetical protein N7444_011968 [Penicillium canescens]KAJ6047414.1 hypothetical protein N7460_003561 [Penicillium canescens]KAJ6048996.1 hypothetical protein N7446_011679 [Penicillium canescens]
MLGYILLFGKLFVIVIRKTISQLRLKLTSLIHRHTYKPTSNPRNIVVVGASFAGYHAARCLANSLPTGYRVVVIEKNSHFQLTWVLPRFCVVEGSEHKALIPYWPYLQAPLGSYQWVTDSVTTIQPGGDSKGRNGKVQVSSGDWIDYEYLVLATGSTARLPSRVNWESKKDGMKAMQYQQRRFKEARDIVVVGGGAAGVELATDAKSQYPEKNVTLIHSHETLLSDGFGSKMHDVAKKALEDLGIDLVLGKRPVLPRDETGNIELGDRKVHFDCLVKCIGQKPNSDLAHFLASSAIAPSGHLNVRSTLQVNDERFSNIYAAGDLINVGTIKNGRSAMEQGEAVSQNILRAIRGKQQVIYQQKWWEGLTKLTLGLGKSIVYLNDGHTEMTIALRNQKIELDSAAVWKHLGATPYKDESGA